MSDKVRLGPALRVAGTSRGAHLTAPAQPYPGPSASISQSVRPSHKLAPERVYLSVPYARKNEAKALGARWDVDKRRWFVCPAYVKLEPLAKAGFLTTITE